MNFGGVMPAAFGLSVVKCVATGDPSARTALKQ